MGESSSSSDTVRDSVHETVNDHSREVPESATSDDTAPIAALGGGAAGAASLGAAAASGAMAGLAGGPPGVVAGATTGFILGAATGGALGAAAASLVLQDEPEDSAN